MHDQEDHFDGPWPPAVDLVRDLVDEICADAYDESEQVVAMFTAFDEWAKLPSPATRATTARTVEGLISGGPWLAPDAGSP